MYINTEIICYNTVPIGSMYGIYANIWGILMVNVTIYSIHGSYGNHQIYINFVEFYFETYPDWFALPLHCWKLVESSR
jgi:hypothetical protein